MPTRRLPDDTRKAIEADLEKGELTHRELAKKYHVGTGTIANIKKGLVKSPLDQPDPTDKHILKLEAQVIALKDENSRCKQSYKAAQRENSVFEALTDELAGCITPIKPLPKAVKHKTKSKRIKESLVALLSDEHADQIILPHQVGGLERYNFSIALRRAEEYVDTLLKFSQRTLSNYQFDTLWIFANGDHVSGEIHGASDHSQYRNMLRNSLAVGQMHSLMLRDLAPHFREIKIVYTPGNHGRRSIKKDYHGAWDNWDYLVAETARLHCINIKNIEFLIPDAFSVCVDIENHGFHVTHGEEIQSWMGIPFYGISRKTMRLTALNAAQKRKIDCYIFGHFHTASMLSALDGETIINGPWPATDPYAYEKMSVFSEPSQWLFGVNRKRGISWRLNMKLRTEREHLGPDRYVVNLAKEM